jgi:hypothetical protein
MGIFEPDRDDGDDPIDDAPAWAIEIDAKLDRLDAKLDRLLKITNRTENELMIDTTKITADITAQTTVLQGVVVAAQALNANNAALTQQVADLKAAVAAAGTPDAATQAAIDQLDAGVTANTTIVAGLVPAVTANTPTPAPVAAAAVAQAATPPAA